VAYTVEVAPAAQRQIRKLDSETQRRVLKVLEQLGAEPRPHDSIKLQAAEDFYRVRIGDYRVIYEISDRRLVVLVLKVGNRRDIYRNL
jgi:mRNA interferase RelE/StbE